MPLLPVKTLSAFFVVAVLLGLAPGPDNVFVLMQSALYGRNLLWLAWQVLRAPTDAPPDTAVSTLGDWALYRRGVIMNLTNPKVSVFFLAFLPQFADPARGALAGQIVLLGLAFIVATLAPHAQPGRRRRVPGARGPARADRALNGPPRAAYTAWA